MSSARSWLTSSRVSASSSSLVLRTYLGSLMGFRICSKESQLWLLFVVIIILLLSHSLTQSLTRLAFASNRKLDRQKLSIQKCFRGFNMLDFSNNCNSSHNSSTAPWNSSYKKVHTESQNPAHLQQQQQQHPTISQQPPHLNLNLPTTTATTKEKADL